MTRLRFMPRARAALLALTAALALSFTFTAASLAHDAPRRAASGPAVASLTPDPRPVGSQQFAVLLCRFSDSDPDQDPHDTAFFEDMLRNERPGLDHYWREVSYGRIDLVGSRVFDWKTLPGRYEDYELRVNGEPRADYYAIGDACVAAHDRTDPGRPSVDFTPFEGIAVLWDREFSDHSYGGREERELDGQRREWGMVWSDAADISQQTMAHEMGHSFGLTHSPGPYGQAYDSQWDVMSGGFDEFEYGEEDPADFPFGNVATHINAANKDRLGWIPAARKFTLAPGKRAIVTLARLAQPGASGYLLAQVPIQGSGSQFYTVELRQDLSFEDSSRITRKVSYDDGTPASFGGAVVIHRVDQSLTTNNAQVVDPDGDGDPNDDGAIWRAGETFADPANGVAIQVNSINREAGTAVITVDNRPSLTIADVTVSEPSAPNSTSQARFTVRLSNASSQAIGLDYFTTAGMATKDVDYAHVANSHLSIPAGAKTATITINVKIDTLTESSETFFVNLKNPIGATIADAQAKGVILDRPPTLPAPTPTPCPPPGVNCQAP